MPDLRVADAAETLARAMVDEPSSRWLLPDPDEFVAVHRELYAALIRLGCDEGRVDTWGEPVVGVAVWLERPPISTAGSHQRAAPAQRQLPDVFPAHAAERVERYSAVIRQLRERARPDRHAYLDTVAVLPEHRRRGIATRLLEAGHAWADAAGLPCALETETAQNVVFYRRRGYQVVAELGIPGTELTVSSLRRPRPDTRPGK
jgi:GNAT superfamily N-acetyltransferase